MPAPTGMLPVGALIIGAPQRTTGGTPGGIHSTPETTMPLDGGGSPDAGGTAVTAVGACVKIY